MTQIKETTTTYTTAPTHLTTAQAATRLSLTARTIRALCNSGELQKAGIGATKTGEGAAGDWHISAEDITALFGTENAITPEFYQVVFNYDLQTIRRFCKSEKIKAVKLGREWRIHSSEVAGKIAAVREAAEKLGRDS